MYRMWKSARSATHARRRTWSTSGAAKGGPAGTVGDPMLIILYLTVVSVVLICGAVFIFGVIMGVG